MPNESFQQPDMIQYRLLEIQMVGLLWHVFPRIFERGVPEPEWRLHGLDGESSIVMNSFFQSHIVQALIILEIARTNMQLGSIMITVLVGNSVVGPVSVRVQNMFHGKLQLSL